MLRGELRPELSERELEVVKLVAVGLTAKEIAYRLKLHPQTVKNFMAKAKERLGLHTGIELTRWAIKNGHVEC